MSPLHADSTSRSRATEELRARPRVRSRVGRALLVSAGTSSLGLAVLGIWLPVLPTTPLVLLAAWLFSLSSERFHSLLLESRLFGPIISDWERHRALPVRVKILTVVILAVSISISSAWLVFAHGKPAWAIVVALIGIAVAAFVLRIPTRPKVEGEER
ncbi:MAG TPA: YbaN family protein [Planctomycetota bacterium]|nr:YbaN family protein [Planctomycetota bacterium]